MRFNLAVPPYGLICISIDVTALSRLDSGQLDYLQFLPLLDQVTANALVGLGDGILLGQGEALRGILGIDGRIDPDATGS